MKLFNSITKITTSGYLRLNINQKGEFDLSDDIEVEQKGHTLHIRCDNKIIINGNYSMGNNNSNIVTGDNNFIFNNDGCTVLHQGNYNTSQIVVNSNVNGNLTFNNSQVCQNNSHVSQNRSNEPVNSYMLEDSVIDVVSMNGSGKISINDALLSRNLQVGLYGSGKVLLSDGGFEYLKLTLTGSGDIIGKNVVTKNTEINLTGSGDIKGFRILNTGSLNLVGSGDIKVSKPPESTLYKNRIGSGRISIN